MMLDKVWWMLLIVAFLSYLLGNFNSAITISKLKKKDIRTMGSGNPGTMNMSRNFGLKIGLLVFLLDFLKGVIPALTAKIVFQQFDFGIQPVYIAAQYTAGLFAVMGHVFPFAFKFKGGKGIATTIGALVVGEWYLTIGLGVLALCFIFVTKMGSMGSFLATAPAAIASSIKFYLTYYNALKSSGETLFVFVIANVMLFLIIILTWFAHRVNIVKLMSGDEHETNWSQMIKDAILKKKLKKADKEKE